VDNDLVSRYALHGQVIEKFWSNNCADWERQVEKALDGIDAETALRPKGNKRRFPIGTTAPVVCDEHNFLFVALSRTNLADNITKANTDDLIVAIRGLLKCARKKCAKAEGEGEWNARKHGGPKRRIWRKIHIGIDEKTLEVRAVEVTSSNIGDAPMLPELLNQIPNDQDIGSVTGDGAYDTRKCHDAIAARNAHAVIPPRKNAKPWKPTSAGAPLGRFGFAKSPADNDRPERSGQRLTILGPCHLATMERIPPKKPCRDQDALCEADGAKPHGERL